MKMNVEKMLGKYIEHMGKKAKTTKAPSCFGPWHQPVRPLAKAAKLESKIK